MKKVKVVMPLKDAIIEIVERGKTEHLQTDSVNHLSIYGIPVNEWPAGKEVINRKVNGYFIPEIATIEQEEHENVPEFIKNLKAALEGFCFDLECNKCPLDCFGQCKAAEILAKIDRVWDKF